MRRVNECEMNEKSRIRTLCIYASRKTHLNLCTDFSIREINIIVNLSVALYDVRS